QQHRFFDRHGLVAEFDFAAVGDRVDALDDSGGVPGAVLEFEERFYEFRLGTAGEPERGQGDGEHRRAHHPRGLALLSHWNLLLFICSMDWNAYVGKACGPPQRWARERPFISL